MKKDTNNLIKCSNLNDPVAFFSTQYVQAEDLNGLGQN